MRFFFVSTISTSSDEELRYLLNNVNITSLLSIHIYIVLLPFFHVFFVICSMLSSFSSWQWNFTQFFFHCLVVKMFTAKQIGGHESCYTQGKFLISTPPESCAFAFFFIKYLKNISTATKTVIFLSL